MAPSDRRDHPPRPVEADHPGGGLGRQADLGAEPGGEMALAPADGARDVGDPGRAVRRAQEVPGVADLGGRPPGRVDEPSETLVEQPEAFGPARRRASAPGSSSPSRPSRSVASRSRPASSPAGTPNSARVPSGLSCELDAGLGAVVLDDGGAGVQPADQGAYESGACAASGCRVTCSGSSSVTITVRYGDGRPRWRAGGTWRNRKAWCSATTARSGAGRAEPSCGERLPGPDRAYPQQGRRRTVRGAGVPRSLQGGSVRSASQAVLLVERRPWPATSRPQRSTPSSRCASAGGSSSPPARSTAAPARPGTTGRWAWSSRRTSSGSGGRRWSPAARTSSASTAR